MPRGFLFIDVDSKNFDIYRTKDGLHIIAKLDKRGFDYNFSRIRISPKYNSKGKIVNPEPKLLICGCPNKHKDKRTRGKLSPYLTKSK